MTHQQDVLSTAGDQALTSGLATQRIKVYPCPQYSWNGKRERHNSSYDASKEKRGLFSAYCHDSLSEGFEAAGKNVTHTTDRDKDSGWGGGVTTGDMVSVCRGRGGVGRD